MQQLEDIISNPKVIVIRAVRSTDQAIVTATRVPVGDIRLEEWGWILSISHKNNHAQDELEELSNRDGNHYPKLYLPDDLKAYAAQWQCAEWEDVYQKKNEEDLTLTATTVLTPPLADEKENLNEAISEIQTKIMAQLASFNQAMEDRLQKHTQILTAQANAMMNTLTTNTKALNEKDEKTEVLSAQAVALRRKIDELEIKTETLTTNAPHLTDQVEMLTTTVNEIMTKLDDIKAQIKKSIAEDENSKSGNSDDIEVIASDIEKKTTSHIEKLAINQIRLGNGFYKNVNTQSKQSFDLARFLVVIGAAIFVISMIAFIIPISTGNTTVVGSVGIITSCIIEVIGGLSFLYNRASVQLAHFHLFLDRINRASIAHAMCDNIKDENKKTDQVILVVKELLRDDERIKG